MQTPREQMGDDLPFVPTHPGIDLSLIEGVIRRWARRAEKLSMILSAYRQKGGWEGWVQVELAREFDLVSDELITFGASIAASVEREVRLYEENTQERADLVIQCFEPGSSYKIITSTFVIELKCESWNNSQNFKTGVREDITQLTKELDPLTLAHDGSPPVLLAIAINVTDNGLGQMLDLRKDPTIIPLSSIYLGDNCGQQIRAWIFCPHTEGSLPCYQDFPQGARPSTNFISASAKAWAAAYQQHLSGTRIVSGEGLLLYHATALQFVSLEKALEAFGAAPGVEVKASAARQILETVVAESLPFNEAREMSILDFLPIIDQERYRTTRLSKRALIAQAFPTVARSGF